MSAYIASKHGVLGLTRTAAVEYGAQGIRVNALCPGAIRTPMTDRLLGADPERAERMAQFIPMARFGTPDEVAEAAVWLCSDAAAYVNGLALPIDGGYPGPLGNRPAGFAVTRGPKPASTLECECRATG